MINGRAIHIQGTVQGVGFRPFVYGLAMRYGLSGWVLNNSAGVQIEVHGNEDSILEFIRSLRAEAPPLAVIDSLDVRALSHAPQGPPDEKAPPLFMILESENEPQAFVPISPDVTTCEDCLRELFDPADRRYRYPFINCTNCGPRFTIVRDIPYDRPLTTMSSFAMCPECQAEYENPVNRRFHAQPNACPVCGPQYSLFASPGKDGISLKPFGLPFTGEDAILAAQRLLDDGSILAIKGLGGYHLACNAADDDAVQRLRERKGRVDKPFAVMAADVEAVRTFAHVTDSELALLTSRQRPIVLLIKRDDSWLSAFIAPGNDRIGVMLPYTPMHHLLMRSMANAAEPSSQTRVYVMTSGNLSEEPIVKDNDEALARLSPIVDAFLDHNRDIFIHCDDSVVRTFRDSTSFVRRARGYAPAPIRLPQPVQPILAVGGELKNTFCLTNGSYAFMSQHIGDMENLETLQAFERTVEHYRRIFRVKPEIIACDLHPGYLSTRWAKQFAEERRLPLIGVQHHHAHIAAAMAEHGLASGEQVIGLSLDGTGFGTDDTIWGGEVLLASYAEFARFARVRPVPLPGGDAAIRRPYRIALAYLCDAGLDWSHDLPPVLAATDEELRILRRQLETGLNTTRTSSMGRFFDAIAALTGVRQTISYEAQAAMEFESLASAGESGTYDVHDVLTTIHSDSLQSDDSDLQFELDTRPIVRQVMQDMVRGAARETISARFHDTIALAMYECCRRARDATGLERVALSGGVFQNLRLLGSIMDKLRFGGFDVLMHKQLPANDGGLALGQAMVANAKSNDVVHTKGKPK